MRLAALLQARQVSLESLVPALHDRLKVAEADADHSNRLVILEMIRLMRGAFRRRSMIRGLDLLFSSREELTSAARIFTTHLKASLRSLPNSREATDYDM